MKEVIQLGTRRCQRHIIVSKTPAHLKSVHNAWKMNTKVASAEPRAAGVLVLFNGDLGRPPVLNLLHQFVSSIPLKYSSSCLHYLLSRSAASSCADNEPGGAAQPQPADGRLHTAI